VGDVVEATVAAMAGASPGSLYNVGGGEEAALTEVIALLERVSRREARLRRVERAAGDVLRTKADTARIHADLGWAPTTRLEDGLRAQWDWAAASSSSASRP
jgi:nucleoside-diphosphate-sugar epimerase